LILGGKVWSAGTASEFQTGNKFDEGVLTGTLKHI